jgi:ParB family chromosome partitioning protein
MPAIASSLNDPNIIHWIPPDRLQLRAQVRRVFDAESLAGLAENIRRHGIIQPIVCFLDDGSPVVIDGERRVRAGIIADQSRLPVRILTDPLDVAKVRARQLAANLQRVDLTPIEQAEGIQKYLEESGVTAEQAAAELGKSPSAVSRTLAILRLSPEHKQLVAEGKILAEAAYLLTRVLDPEKRDALAKRSAAGILTRDALADEVRALGAAGQAPSIASAEHTAARPRASVWRMTRTIGVGVALAVTGTGLTLEEIVHLLEAFIVRARVAIGEKVPVARFLSEFRHEATQAPKGGAA